MRPTIVSWLNGVFGTSVFEFLVPHIAGVYALTMLACLIVFVRRCGWIGLSKHLALGGAIAAMIGGLIGARVLFVVIYLDSHPDILSSLFATSGATISWGAYGGGLLGFFGYFAFRRQSSLPYLDAVGSVMGLGPFLGRFGCMLNGCDFGTVASVPWSIVYPHASIPFVDHVSRGWVDPLADYSLPLHPVQLYLSLNGLLLFLVFSRLWRRIRLKPGALFCLYWAAYSATRFFWEFFRGDTRTFYFHTFSIGQIVALFILFMSLIALLLVRFPSRIEDFNPERR